MNINQTEYISWQDQYLDNLSIMQKKVLIKTTRSDFEGETMAFALTVEQKKKLKKLDKKIKKLKQFKKK